jgi:hypothetical protein
MSCQHSLIVEDAKGVRSLCSSGYNEMVQVYPPVLQCNRCESVKQKSVHELEKIAWFLKVTDTGKTIGFRPPEPRKKRTIDLD